MFTEQCCAGKPPPNKYVKERVNTMDIERVFELLQAEQRNIRIAYGKGDNDIISNFIRQREEQTKHLLLQMMKEQITKDMKQDVQKETKVVADQLRESFQRSLKEEVRKDILDGLKLK